MSVNLSLTRKLRVLSREDLSLDDCLPPLGPYPLKYEVWTELACLIFRLSLQKGRYAENFQWLSMHK